MDSAAPAAPAAPISYTDNVGSVTSATSTAATTDDTTPGINVGIGLTDTPSLYVDGVKVAATYDSATGTLTPTTALTSGLHALSYALTDAAGNESDPSPALSLTVDSAAPAAPAVVLSQDTANATDFVTSNGTLDVTGLEVGATWQYTLDGGANWLDGNGGAVSAGTTGSFVAAHGSYASGQVQVRQSDAAGNTSTQGILLHPNVTPNAHQLDGQGGADTQPQITALNDGGYTVTWQGFNADNSTSNIFVQRFDSANAVVGTPIELNGLGGTDTSPQITNMNDGGYVLTWRGNSADGLNSNVFVQRYNSSNMAVGTQISLDGQGGADINTQITAMADGGYLVTWQGFNAGNSTSNIFVQRFDSANVAVSSQTALDGLGGIDSVPQITAMADGGYLVAWGARSADSSIRNVFLQRFDNTDTTVGSPIEFDALGGWDINPQITALNDGGYAVTWAGYNADATTSNIFVQRYNSTNTVVGSQIEFSSAGVFGLTPQITAMSDGGYVVIWEGDAANTSTRNVYALRFNSANVPVGIPIALDGLVGSDQTPQITAMTDGGYVVTWRGNSPTGSTSDVFVQRFDNANTAVGSPIALDGMGGGDQQPQITAMNDGGYVVTWRGISADGLSSNIFVQRFTADNARVTEVDNLVIDTVIPAVTIFMSDTNLIAGETSLVTFTFSERVLGFSNSDVTVENGTLSSVGTADGGLTYTATFTPTASTADSLNSINVLPNNYADLAGNVGSGNASTNYTVDTLVPTVTITDNVIGTAGDNVNYTFTFSETVTGFDINDLTTSLGTWTNFTGSGATYTATLDMSAVRGSASIVVGVAVDAFSDLAGNANTAAASDTQAYDDIIDLGTGQGQLIRGVNVEGNWYYAWDRNGDGVHGGVNDGMSLNSLDSIFNKNSAGVVEVAGNAVGEVGDIDTTFRFGSLNGVSLALPTMGIAPPISQFGLTPEGTAVDNPSTLNSTYNDLLAIWDAFNGGDTTTGTNGTPAGWATDFFFWSATANNSTDHAVIFFNDGYVGLSDESNNNLYAALQVL